METINVFEPRYHDGQVLVRGWRLYAGAYRIVLTKARYKPIIRTREELKSYPVEMKPSKAGKLLPFHVIPLEEFENDPAKNLKQESLL